MRLFLVFVTITLFSLVGCFEEQSVDGKAKCSKVNGTFVQKEILYICGILDANLAKDVDEILDYNGVDNVVIDSAGGFSDASISIVNSINKHKKEVLFVNKCLSSCAHFLLLGIENILIEEETIIGFHHTQSVIEYYRSMYSHIPGNRLTGQQAKLEKDFFKKIGIDESFLYTPFANNPASLLTFDNNPNEYWASGARYDFNYIVPSRQKIEKIRDFSKSDYWPSSQSQIDNQIADKKLKLKILFADVWREKIELEELKINLCTGAHEETKKGIKFHPKECQYSNE